MPTGRTTIIRARRETFIASLWRKDCHSRGRSSITWSRREKEGITIVTQRAIETGSEVRYMDTRKKRAPNLRCDGGTNPIEIDANIKLLGLMLQRHKVCGGSTPA